MQGSGEGAELFMLSELQRNLRHGTTFSSRDRKWEQGRGPAHVYQVVYPGKEQLPKIERVSPLIERAPQPMFSAAPGFDRVAKMQPLHAGSTPSPESAY